MTPPVPVRSMTSATALPRKAGAVRQTSIVRCQSSRLICRRLPSRRQAALLTKTSMRPQRATASWATCCRKAGAAKSPDNTKTSAPGCALSTSASEWRAASSMSTRVSRQPSAANFWAMARPIPPAAPVRMTDFPCIMGDRWFWHSQHRCPRGSHRPTRQHLPAGIRPAPYPQPE